MTIAVDLGRKATKQTKQTKNTDVVTAFCVIRICFQASPTAGVIGYLYEFDCKPYIKGDVGGSKTWATVAFEKQVIFLSCRSFIFTHAFLWIYL